MDWRERYEEVNDIGQPVKGVFFYDGKPVAYMFVSDGGDVYPSIATNTLIPKKKPPTYRPYKRGEVKCGDVFLCKERKHEWMVTYVGDASVCLNGINGYQPSYYLLFHDFTHLDGTPAGVAE